MKASGIYFRVFLSIMLAVAVTTVFSLTSFAAPDTSFKTLDPVAAILIQDSGTLTGKATINGNPTESGATVMSGSTISTGSDSATIDLGTLGRIELRPNTTINLTFGAGAVTITSQCGTTEVDVKRGEAQLRRGSGDAQSIKAGEDEKFSGSAQITTSGATDLVIDCESRTGGGGAYVGAGLLGLLALIGVGGAVALGIAAGEGETGGVRIPASGEAP